MERTIVFMVIGLVSSPNLFSQSNAIDGFFDYTVGNQWKYEYRSSGEELTQVVQNCETADTLTTCQVENLGELLVQKDSVFITDFFADAGPFQNLGETKFYISNQPLDSTWDACFNCNHFGSRAVVFDTTSFEVFGELIKVKSIGIIQFLSEDDSIGNPVVQLEIAEKFGILSIQYFEGDALVLTGAQINGVTYGSLVVAKEEEEPIPNDFKILGAYPNPFNPETQISIEVTTPTILEVKVFDVLGRLVKSFPQRLYSSGTQTIRLEMNGFGSGLYIVSVSSDTFISTKTITKVK